MGFDKTDVVVIGAGAAGLAAMDQLRRDGRHAICVEARDRIGGRVVTDHALFKQAVDLGAHWLHHADQNPFVTFARDNGFETYAEPQERWLFDGNMRVTGEQLTDFQSALSAAETQLAKGEIVEKSNPKWDDTIDFLIGAYGAGRDLSDLSATDWAGAATGPNRFCRQGFGALLAHHWRDIPVQLNTRVSAINWGENGVQVTTDRGEIHARAVICTLSIGVLRSGAIAFTPVLPIDKTVAINGLTMASYNHVILHFRKDAIPAPPDTEILHRVPSQGTPHPAGVGIWANIGDSGITMGEIGGGFGRELEIAGPAAALDFVMGQLQMIFGTAIKRDLIHYHVTAWGNDPYALGAYSAAPKGAAHLRADLAKPDGPVIFAGEATHPTLWGTVAGAHFEGIRVAGSQFMSDILN